MKKIRKWIIISKDGKYIPANNKMSYTNDINDACVYYTRSEAVGEIIEKGEKVVEVETKNVLVSTIKKNKRKKKYNPDEEAIKRCVPCSKCKVKPVWGSGFLYCPKCGKESDNSHKKGSAVRNWNQKNKRKK